MRSRNLVHGTPCLNDNGAINGIHFVTDEKGRKVAVQIGLKKHRELLEKVWRALVLEQRREEKSVPRPASRRP